MIKSSRRDLILRMGAWPLLWPIVRETGARAQTTTPRRVLVIFTPNGPTMEKGPAVGTENDFTVHDWWQPIARHKDIGLFFTKMMQAGVPFGKHNEYGHQSGGTGALTARTTEGTNNATGPSLDQFIGQELQKRGVITPKRNLAWGLHKSVGNWGPWYEAAGKPATLQNNPYLALNDIAPGLGTGVTGVVGPDNRLVRKRNVLDAVYKDCKELTTGLGAEGKAILDFHCTNIDSLQKSVLKSLQAPATPRPGTCAVPAKPDTMLAQNANYDAADNRDDIVGAFASLTSLAFACDVTRVIGFSFGGTSARFAPPSKYMVPSSDKVDSGDSGPQHHAWTHVYNTGDTKRNALKIIYTWYSEQVARFIDKLRATKDADGKSLMDSTLVLWTSELGSMNNQIEPHSNTNIPVLVFGNGAGAFKTNRLYTGDGSANSALILHSLFVSIIQHAGLTNITAFGNKGMGPLDWLKG